MVVTTHAGEKVRRPARHCHWWSDGDRQVHFASDAAVTPTDRMHEAAETTARVIASIIGISVALDGGQMAY